MGITSSFIFTVQDVYHCSALFLQGSSELCVKV